MRIVRTGLLVLALVGIGLCNAQAADEAAPPSSTSECCKPGDSTPPTELVKKIPKGQLKSPYQDFAKVAKEGHHQFLRTGCNECHGGTGGGGICPPLTQGIWFWGSDDDTLFRLITLGTEGLKKEGYKRLSQGQVKGPMPAYGKVIQTSDYLWKMIAWIRSINPPASPPSSISSR